MQLSKKEDLVMLLVGNTQALASSLGRRVREFIPAICERTGLSYLRSLTMLSPGRLNLAFYAQSDVGPVLLRARFLIDPEYHQTPGGERWSYLLIQDIPIDRPRLIASADAANDIPFAWTLLEFIHGDRL